MNLYHVIYRIGFVRRHIDVPARSVEHAQRRLLRERPAANIETVELVSAAAVA